MKFKKLYFLILLLLTSVLQINAQKWFPIGATWYYNYIPSDAGELENEGKDYNHYFTYEVEKDTVIEGKTCQKLISKYYRSETEIINWESQYVRYDEDSNKVYHYWDNEFHMLYDFTLSVGDTFRTTLYSYPHKYFYIEFGDNGQCNVDFLVDSIFYKAIDDTLYKSYGLKFNDTLMTHSGFYGYTEKIGVVSLFFGCVELGPIFTDEFPNSPYGPLRCYQDNEVYYVNDTRWNSCDYLNSVNKASIENPFLIIKLDKKEYLIKSDNMEEFKFSIYDTKGSLLSSKKGMTKKTQFRLDKSGIYFIIISDNRGNFYNHKILVK